MIEPSTVRVAIPAVVFLVIAFDVWLAKDSKLGNTYSEVLRAWFKAWTPLWYAVSFGLGVLMGHWGPV